MRREINGFGSNGAIKKGLLALVPSGRLELPSPCEHHPLKMACLPISPTGRKKSDSAGVRTQDPLIKSQMLYQLSYRINLKMNVRFKREHKDMEFLRMAKRFFTFFSFFSLFLFGTGSIALADMDYFDPASAFESGNKAFEAAKYTEAMTLYEKVYASGKFSENMLYRLAYMHENLRQYPEAIYYLKKAGQEYGDKNSEAKVRQLMQRQGGTRFFSGDGWNGYLSFFRDWKWLFYGLFFAAIIGIGLHYILPRTGVPIWRSIGVGVAWTVFGILTIYFLHRSTMVPQRAILMEETSFYSGPGFSAASRPKAFSLGETLDITDREDVWVQVAAGGRAWWVPNWVVKEL